MCPACIASGAMALAGVTSTGGLAAFFMKIFFWKSDRRKIVSNQKAKEKP